MTGVSGRDRERADPVHPPSRARPDRRRVDSRLAVPRAAGRGCLSWALGLAPDLSGPDQQCDPLPWGRQGTPTRAGRSGRSSEEAATELTDIDGDDLVHDVDLDACNAEALDAMYRPGRAWGPALPSTSSATSRPRGVGRVATSRTRQRNELHLARVPAPSGAGGAERPRAARAVRNAGLPGAVGGADATDRARRVAARAHRRGGPTEILELAGVHGAAGRGDHRRHPLRHEVVEARHGLDRRPDRRAARRGRDQRHLRGGPLVRRLHDEPAARRPRRREGLGSLPLRRRTARAGARGPGPPARPAPLLLEEREVLRAIELRADDAPGFWEGYGYHNYGDPWREQRYSGD